MSQDGIVSSWGTQIHSDGQCLDILLALQVPLNRVKVEYSRECLMLAMQTIKIFHFS